MGAIPRHVPVQEIKYHSAGIAWHSIQQVEIWLVSMACPRASVCSFVQINFRGRFVSTAASLVTSPAERSNCFPPRSL